MPEKAEIQQTRRRVQASQSAKGIWQLEATVETFDGSDPVKELWALIAEAEVTAQAAGRRLASDVT